ncbi:MAG: hypothetical protein H0T46_14630 [Deltaproteobacteria bacterium]|nr:hypothetical protein [Deltaproteobacteria bacterium]
MFWLITMLATLGVGGVSLFATLNRMGANLEKLFDAAPELTESKLAEGAFGRITGVVTGRGQLPTAPGIGISCALYELVVYSAHDDRHGSGWRVVHRELVGGELDIMVGDTVVRFDASNLYVVSAPSHDANTDLRRGAEHGSYTSRVRYVPDGATVRVVGTLTREVDADPSAQNNYREVATRYRLMGSRRHPVVLAA